MTSKPHQYFPCLDEMRVLAAAAIVVMHTEQIKSLLGFDNIYHTISNWSIAVTFFFVLSGFLITYLLLAERDDSGTVHLRRFYMRRALRIWPVYYLVVLMGLFVIPYVPSLALSNPSESVGENWWVKAALFLAFLPNVAFVIYRPVPYAAQAWSIGAEEQFYLTWPLLLKFTRRHLLAMVLVVVLTVAARVGVEHLQPNSHLTAMFVVTQISSMAIGGIMAYLLFHRKRATLSLLFHPATQILAIVLLAGIIGTRSTIPLVHLEVHALLFACIILNAAGNPRAIFQPRSWWLASLGTLSYGIYMYHPWAIGLSVWLLSGGLGLNLGSFGPAVLLHGLTVAITVGVSFLSYRYLETPFLKLKGRFAAKPATLEPVALEGVQPGAKAA